MNKPSSSSCKIAAARAPRGLRLPRVLTRAAVTFACACALADAPATLHAQSLWKSDKTTSIFADRRGRSVGEIITIIVQENNTATKQNNTKTARKSSADYSISSFLYGPSASGLLTQGGKYPGLKLSGAKDFDGGGSINNSESINTRVAVKIIEVLPNNNLVVEGRRETSFSGETQEAILRGVVRSDDVTTANTVLSYNIADATIKFVSKGGVTDSQNRGWFTRVWDKISPF